MYELKQTWFGNWRVYFTSPTTHDRTWVATFRYRCLAEAYANRHSEAYWVISNNRVQVYEPREAA